MVTVDSVSGTLINSFNSSVGDSVDGNLSLDSLTAIKDFINLESQNSDGNYSIVTQIPGGSNTISTIDGNITTNQLQELQASTSVASVPQVIIVDSSERNSLLGKRPADGTAQNSIVNKFIITKNQNASQAFPVQVQTINASQNVTVQPGATLLSDSTGTKTITITQQGLTSPMKGITMNQIVNSPSKVPISKLPISPAKTPTKITMIPVSGRSPQRIAPAGNSVLTNSTSQATITMSPSKVIKQPGTVHVVRYDTAYYMPCNQY